MLHLVMSVGFPDDHEAMSFVKGPGASINLEHPESDGHMLLLGLAQDLSEEM